MKPSRAIAVAFVLATTALAAAPAAAEGIATDTILPLASQQQANVTTAGDQGAPQVVADSGTGYVVFYRSGSDLARVRHARSGLVVPSSDELLVAKFVTGDPSAARLADGRSVLVWAATVGDGSSDGIFGRLFSGEGESLASAFPINSVTDGWQGEADVAALADGGFIVTWRSGTAPAGEVALEGFSTVVVQRRFDSTGQPIGSDRLVSSAEGDHYDAAVAGLAGGGWVVAWRSNTGGEGDVRFRRYAASGDPIGAEGPLAYYVTGNQLNPDVIGLPDGGFLAVWEGATAAGLPAGEGGDGVPAGIVARPFDSNGDAVVVENTVLVSSQVGTVTRPSLAAFGPHLYLVTAGGTHPWACTVDPRDGSRIGTSFPVLVDPWISIVRRVVAAFNRSDSMLLVWDSDVAGSADTDGSSVQVRGYWGGLVGHWKRRDALFPSLLDNAGSNDNSTEPLGGGASWVPGRLLGSQAAAFSGNSFAEPSISSELQLIIPGPDGGFGVTLAAWVWLETLPSAMTEPFQSIYDGVEDNFVLYLDRDNAELRFKATLADASTQRPGIPESALAIHRWLHVAGVYESDGDYRIYLDGVQQDHHAGNAAAVRTSPGQAAVFGRDGFNDQYHFEGAIDEAWLAARAFDPREIELLRGRWIFSDGFERDSFVAWSATAP
jgi:hypothetical protein